MFAAGLKTDRRDTTAMFALGTLAFTSGSDGTKGFLYVEFGEAITAAGYACVVDGSNVAEMVDTTSTAPGAGVGGRVGAAMADFASGEYGWIQVYGKGSIRTLASAAAGTRLNSTATAGALDDDGTAGAEQIAGITLGTATGGSAATNADAYFNFPFVSVTL